MSRTKRVYNEKMVGTVRSNGYYHPYKQVCMGRCPHCRDIKNKDPDKIRKRTKQTLRREIVKEIQAGDT